MSTETPIARAMRLHRTGEWEKARQLYRRILKKTPDSVDALHFFGVLNFQRGRSERAIELISSALAINPDYPDAHNNLGNVYLKLGRLEDARQCYEKTLTLDPRRVETHNNLGILLRHQQEYQASADHLNTAVALAPDWADAHYNLANTLVAAGLNDAAIDYYRAALQRDPKFSEALRRLGILLYQFGRVDEAVQVYRDWLELEPGNPVAAHMLAACSSEGVPMQASAAFVTQLFDRFAASFDSQLERLDYKAPRLLTDQVKSLRPNAERQLVVLDAGCGTGLCGPLLRPVAKKLFGVDLSENMLNLARERDCYDRLERGDLVDYLRRFSGVFDLVVSADTLVYFGDLKVVMTAASQALKTGGLFAFSLESLRENPEQAGYRLEPHGRYAHTREFIEAAIADAGLIVARFDTGVLRKELGLPVPGWLVVAELPGAGPS